MEVTVSHLCVYWFMKIPTLHENNRIFKNILCIYFIICGLFNDAVSSLDYIALDDRMINE
jgi:hypothetical protein